MRSRVSDAETVALCTDASCAVVGIDIPFGWPRAFAELVAAWSPTASTPAPPDPSAFRLRLTDQVVRSELRKEPLSVSADRIAMGTRSLCALLAAHELGAQVDVEGRARATGPALIEVYPGASAKVLGHGRPVLSDEASYKRDPSVRRSLVRHVASTLNVELGGFEDKLVREAKRSDETDAFLAALTAALYAAHCLELFALPGWQVRCPESDAEREAARAEGWMFFPVRAA